MCRLVDSLIYDSEKQSTCVLSARSSTGRLYITAQEEERFRVYDLEDYLGKRPIKRPDRLLIGRVGEGPWVVVLVDLKSRGGWETALEQFRGVLPALAKGGTAGGEEHHRECGGRLPLGKDHRVVAVVVGALGREFRQSRSRGDRRMAEREKERLQYGGKRVRIVSPISTRRFESLKAFWVQIGVLPRSG